jgi:hypothetical protein
LFFFDLVYRVFLYSFSHGIRRRPEWSGVLPSPSPIHGYAMAVDPRAMVSPLHVAPSRRNIWGRTPDHSGPLAFARSPANARFCIALFVFILSSIFIYFLFYMIMIIILDMEDSYEG